MYIFQNESDIMHQNSDDYVINFTLNAFHYVPKINTEDLAFIKGNNFYIPTYYNSYRQSLVTTNKASKLHLLISSLIALYDNEQDRFYLNENKSKNKIDINHLNNLLTMSSDYDDKCIEYYYSKIKKVFKDYTGLDIVLAENFIEDTKIYCVPTIMAGIIKFSNTYYGFYNCIKDIIFSDGIQFCLDDYHGIDPISNGAILHAISKDSDLYRITDNDNNYEVSYNGTYLNIYNELQHIIEKIDNNTSYNLKNINAHDLNTYISVIGIKGLMNCYEAWVRLKERNYKIYEHINIRCK